MRHVNMEDFVVKHTPSSQHSYIKVDLSYSDKDQLDVVAKTTVNLEGKKSYGLKRTVSNRFYNPHDVNDPRDDIRYSDDTLKPRWVNVSKECFDKYMEFLEHGSRVALAKAEREFYST